MNGLLGMALTNAAGATLLGILVAFASRWIRRPAVVHAMWVVVLCQLLVPPVFRIAVLPAAATERIARARASIAAALPKVPWATVDGEPRSSTGTRPSGSYEPRTDSAHSFGSGSAVDKAPQVSGSPRTAAGRVARDSGFSPTTGPIGAELDHAGAVPRAATPVVTGREQAGVPDADAHEFSVLATANGAGGRLRTTSLVGIVWLAGMLAVLLVGISRAARFTRRVRGAPEAHDALRTHVASLATIIGLRRRPGLRLVPARISPLLWFRRGSPEVLFPERLLASLTEGERDTLLLHELAHVKRRDHWVRLFEFAATTAFWWHPLLYWARREMRRAEERSCDIWVLRCRPGRAGEYARGLIKTVEFLAGERPASPALASGLGAYRLIEERLTMIMKTNTPKGLSRLQTAALAVVAASVLLISPTRAAKSSTPAAGDPVASDAVLAPAVSTRAAALAPGTAAVARSASAAPAAAASPSRAAAPSIAATPSVAGSPAAAAVGAAPMAAGSTASIGVTASTMSSASPAPIAALAPRGRAAAEDDSEDESGSADDEAMDDEAMDDERALSEDEAASMEAEREAVRQQAEQLRRELAQAGKDTRRKQSLEQKRAELERVLKALEDRQRSRTPQDEEIRKRVAAELDRAMREASEANEGARARALEQEEVALEAYHRALELSNTPMKRKQLLELQEESRRALEELRRAEVAGRAEGHRSSREQQMQDQLSELKATLADLARATERLNAEQRTLRETITTLQQRIQKLQQTQDR